MPVEFLVPWHDERVPRGQSLALYDAFASPDEGLHAGRVAEHGLDSAVRFFGRHLTS